MGVMALLSNLYTENRLMVKLVPGQVSIVRDRIISEDGILLFIDKDIALVQERTVPIYMVSIPDAILKDDNTALLFDGDTQFLKENPNYTIVRTNPNSALSVTPIPVNSNP